MRIKLIELQQKDLECILRIMGAKTLRSPIKNSKIFYQFSDLSIYRSRTLTKLRESDFIDIYVKLINHGHIPSTKYVENCINNWLSQIDEELSKRKVDYADSESLYASVLTDSVFRENPLVYFAICDLQYEGAIDKVCEKVSRNIELRQVELHYEAELQKKDAYYHAQLAEMETSAKAQMESLIKQHEAHLVEIAAKHKEDIITLEKTIADLTASLELLQTQCTERQTALCSTQHLLEEANNQINAFSVKVDSLESEKNALATRVESLMQELTIQRENSMALVAASSSFRIEYIHGISSKEESSDEMEYVLDDNIKALGYSAKDANGISTVVYNAILHQLPIVSIDSLADDIMKAVAATIGGGECCIITFGKDYPDQSSFIDLMKKCNASVVRLKCALGRIDDAYLFALLSACKDSNKVFVLDVLYEKQLRFFPEEILNRIVYIKMPLKKNKAEQFNLCKMSLPIVCNESRISFNELNDTLRDFDLILDIMPIVQFAESDAIIVPLITFNIVPFLCSHRNMHFMDLIDTISNLKIKQSVLNYYG